jgi:aminopeptidase N
VYSQMFFATSGGAVSRDATGVLAHELAHQWYGDSVSLEHWDDIWLNEGFATYAQWLWTEHEGGATPKQTFDALYQGKNGQLLPQDPPGAPTQESMFDSSVYIRGAATLEALRISVGDAAFFRIIRGWAATRAYGNGSTEDFISYAKQVSGKALDEMFHGWLFSRGEPSYPKLLS